LWTRIKTTISCDVSLPTVTEGDSVAVSGVINATVSGETVTLTYTKPDSSTITRSVTTKPDGSYSDQYTPEATGSWSISASWAGDSTYDGATSAVQTFEVNQQEETSTPLPMEVVVVVVVIGVAAVGAGVAWRRARTTSQV
jgi:hypothetical protein